MLFYLGEIVIACLSILLFLGTREDLEDQFH